VQPLFKQLRDDKSAPGLSIMFGRFSPIPLEARNGFLYEFLCLLFFNAALENGRN
jgi:hypothetical protein